MDLPRRYPYNPKWGGILGCAIFFGVCSIVMAYEATHNTVGLIIEGIIRLGPAGANVFYWIMFAGSIGFVIIALLLTVRRIANPRILEVGTDALLLPHGGLQRQTSRIAYSDIQSVSEVQVASQTFLYVTANGRWFTITVSLFPDKESYIAVRDFLVSRAPR